MLKANGAIGIDLNADNIAWAYCDSEGNLKDKGQITINLENKSSGQTTHILSLAIAQILDKATRYQSQFTTASASTSTRNLSSARACTPIKDIAGS